MVLQSYKKNSYLCVLKNQRGPESLFYFDEGLVRANQGVLDAAGYIKRHARMAMQV
jgi:hypothetical protein